MGLTSGPWYLDLAAIASALVSVGVIWHMALWPGMKAFWSAIVSAPKIAEGVGKVVELIEHDVLSDLNDMKVTLRSHLADAAGRDVKIEEHEQRLGKLEDIVFPSRKDN